MSMRILGRWHATVKRTKKLTRKQMCRRAIMGKLKKKNKVEEPPVQDSSAEGTPGQCQAEATPVQ